MNCKFCNNENYDDKCCIKMCWCGNCNHCHFGGICPDGEYWFSEKIESISTVDNRDKRYMNQSHGGHGWVPGCHCWVPGCHCGTRRKN